MFFSSRNHDHDDQGAYPGVPDSLRSDSFEMTEMRKVQEARADTAPYITPYLSLRARLSQLWINRWTVMLLLVLVRVLLLIVQLTSNIGDAKTKALSACSKVEDIGSAVASMPHYLSLGVNDLAATGIDKAVSALMEAMDLMLEGVEAIILFYINFMTATYVCLITAMVHGSLDVVASVTGDATDAFNDIVSKAAGEIDDISGDLTSDLNKITQGIKNSVFGSFVPNIPTVNFSAPIGDLKDFKLNSSDFQKDVRELNDNLPDFAQVQNLTQQAISIPFDLVRNALNDSYGDFSFDKDVFPLAQKQQLTFCSDNDTLNKFFEDLYKLVDKARIIFIVILVLLAIAAIAPMAWLEIRRWHRQQRHAKLIAKNKYDPMDVVYIASRPITASWGIKIASRFNGKRQILVRWCIAYATTTPAILVLSLALAGFFSCFCQFLLLKAIQHEVPALTSEVGQFADQVVKSLESASEEWANGANGVISHTNNTINGDVLDYVVNATDAVNNTLTTFLDTMNDGLNDAFNGTILLDPIKAVLNCVIGIKIESVQKGLTWVHDHAYVDLPLFPNDTFSLGAKDSVGGDSDLNSFLASPSSVTSDDITGAVSHVTNWLHSTLVQEAILSTCLLLVYGIVVLIGVVRMLAGMVSRDRGRAEGGMRFTGNDRPEPAGWETDPVEPEPQPQPQPPYVEKTMSGARSRQVSSYSPGEAYRGFNPGSKF